MSKVEVISKKIDYRQWRGSTADELGYGTGNQYPSLSYRHKADNGQQINVFVVDGRRSDDDPTIVGSTSYNYRLDNMLEVQSTITAHQATARVITAEMPGVTILAKNPRHTEGDFITVPQLVANIMGDFDSIALSQLEAIDAAVSLRSGESIQLRAESLGTAAIAAMLRVLSDDRFTKPLSVSAVDIIESVNTYGNRKFLRPIQVLKKLENIEAPLNEFYFDENRIIGHNAVTSFERISRENMAIWEFLTKKQQLAVISPAIGLHRSLHLALAAGLLGNKNFRDIPIAFYRGVDSSVSLESDVMAAAEALSELGGNTRVVNLVAGLGDETKIGHHFATSLGRYASFAQLLRG
jgi:hypothetical protein